MPESRVFGADEVARKEFATSFRGFDQHDVRAFLGRLAAELAALQTRERSLEERLERAESKAVPREIGEDELETALGVETAKVLHAARGAANEIRNRAEEQVARLLREASDDSTRMREEAASVLAERSAEADRGAAAIRQEASRDAEATRVEAAASAEAAIEAAKEHGRQMVGEAQAVRERMLRDLGRRRRTGQQQLEQLRAGRDRLLEACRSVQAELDIAMAELVVSEPEARAAAETAGLRVASELEPTLEELEAEVAAAVDAGLVLPARAPNEAEVDEERGAELAARPEDGSGRPGASESGSNVAREALIAVAPPSPEGAAPAADGDAVAESKQTFAERVESGQRVVREVPDAGQHEARGPGLRRRKHKGAPATVGVVDLGDASEGVRLLPAEPAVSTAEESAPQAQAPQAQAPGDDAGSSTGAPSGSAEPAVREGTASAAAAQVAGGDTGGEAEGDQDSAAREAADTDEDDGGPRADQLFARIRADRAATVARANEVLADVSQAPAVAAAGARAATASSVPVEEPVPEPASEEATAAVAAFEQRDGEVEAHERALARALKRALADEQNQLLDELRRAKGVPGIDTLLPTVGEHEQRYAAVARKALAAAAAAGGGEDLPDAGVAALATALGHDVVAALRPRLARAIEDGAGDEAAATEALSAAYREWKTSRAEPLARHHVLAAWATGAYAATPDSELLWVVDPEVGCSPDCADNALAGPTMKGVPFPTGQPHPPAHAGCRCLVIPATR